MNRSWFIRGTTFAEMLITLAIGSLLLSGFLSVYWSCSYIYAELAAYTDAHYSVRSSVEHIGRDIRSASDMEILENGTQLRLGQASGEMIRYYLYNHQLFRESANSGGKVRIPIAENISLVNFSGAGSLVTINIEANVGGKPFRLTTSVNSRLVHSNG